MLLVDESVTQYTLARHPRNRAIVDIRNKTTNELKFIKIRHRLTNFYAISLVDPKTFDVWAETQVQSASTRLKPITLQGYEDSILLKGASIFGFEWSFEWENQKYKWVRESPLRPTLECRAAVGGLASSNRRAARYSPRGVKDEYFGLITILDDALAQVEDKRAMCLLLITSLMTILDKTNDNSWKKEKSSGSLFLEPNEIPSIHHPGIDGSTKNRFDGVRETDSDDDDSGSSCSNDDDGKCYDRLMDTGRHKFPSTNEQQQPQSTSKMAMTTSGSVSKEAQSSQMQKSTNDDSGVGYAPQQSPNCGGSSPTHDLRSHQRQQVEYLGHMLSTMKHSGNPTVTLPPSFVQHTTIDTATSWMDDGLVNGQRSRQTFWHHSNYRNNNIQDDIYNNNHLHNHIYDNRKDEEEGLEVGLHSSSSATRRHNIHHYRNRLHRRLSSLDAPHWITFSRPRIPPSSPPVSVRNSLNLHHSIPGSHQ